MISVRDRGRTTYVERLLLAVQLLKLVHNKASSGIYIRILSFVRWEGIL